MWEKQSESLSWHVNGGGLSNALIIDLMKNAEVSNHYQGLYPYNKIPMSCADLTEFTIIFNVGLHFVMVYATSDYVMYVDSMGMPPSHPNMKQFLRRCQRLIVHNIIQIQADTSSYCGLYAALFVIFLDYKQTGKLDSNSKLQFHTSKAVTHKTHNDELKVNDDTCVQFLKNLIQYNVVNTVT